MRDPEFRYRITDYDRTLIPNRFVAFLDDGVTGRDEWLQRSGRSIGHPGWGWVYHSVLMMLDPDRPNVLLETGTNVASTAIIIGQAIVDSGRDALLHTIELDPDIQAEAQRRLELAGVSHVVRSYCGDSVAVSAELAEMIGPIDIAFLDGNHFHDHVIREFDVVVDRLRPGGMAIFDNTRLISEGDEDPRVNGALRTILARYGGNLINMPFCSWYTPGMAVWQRDPFEEMAPPPAGSFVSES